MGVARRRWSPDEKRTVLQLAQEGYTQKQIAEKLRPGVPTAWRSIGDIIREERKKIVSPTVTNAPATSGTPLIPPPKFSTKIELPDSMADSFSAKEFMTMMDDDQRAIFVGTYEDLRGDADEESLTRAENEMLIRAAHSNVKYLRAVSLLNVAESYLMMEMEGAFTNSDEDQAKKRFAGRGDAYKKEAEQWHKEYMELLNDLKLTRKQRLDKIKDTRNTFLDLQQALTDQIRQDSIIEDIKRINMATEEEFHRMAKGEVGPDGKVHSWLIGAFDEYMSEVTQQETKDEENMELAEEPTTEQQTPEGS
jgi:hypothetical protein